MKQWKKLLRKVNLYVIYKTLKFLWGKCPYFKNVFSYMNKNENEEVIYLENGEEST